MNTIGAVRLASGERVTSGDGVTFAAAGALIAQKLSLSRTGWNARFEFEIAAGSWVSLLGPSGAGKTTLLELVAGFEKASSGTLFFENVSLLDEPIHRRPIAYVFQQNALFPSLTAEQNLLLAMHDTKLPEGEKKERVRSMARRVQLEARLQHRPSQLSGGELARMNLARALLRSAKLLLLDEPFAALDAPLRREMTALVRELHAENKFTTLCVTHHPEDAFLFSDRILVFSQGRIVADGSPRDLAHFPKSVEVAKLLDAGLIVQKENATFYVRKDQLTCRDSVRATFSQPQNLQFENWKLGETGDGIVLVCLNSGRYYALDAPESFGGTLYFDADKVVKF